MLSFMPPSQSGHSHPAHHHQAAAYGQHHHQATPASMFQDDLLSQRSRGFSLNTGMMSSAAAASQAFPFTGFPMHPSHDPTYGFLGKCTLIITYHVHNQEIVNSIFVVRK